jgi:NTE family protein
MAAQPATTDAPGRVNVGLALAGGGFRAMLFDLGSVWRLNELGWLPKLDMITSVSGGSITNAILATRWSHLTWSGGVATNFASIVAKPIIEFASRSIDISAGLRGLLSPWESISDKVAKEYDRYLFQGDTLQKSVPEPVTGHTPRFLFYATSLQTGVSVRIEKKRIGDYRIGEVPNPDLPIAKVVATSSAFPPFLSPSILKLDPASWVRTVGADLYDREEFRRRMVLTDGGVYDNMGLQALERCSTVLVCDAGAPFEVQARPWRLWPNQTLRALAIMTEQTRALRRRMLMADFGANQKTSQQSQAPRKKGVYWKLNTKIGDFELADALVTDSAKSAALQHIRTRLNSFTPQEKGELINWGYALADAAMRRHVMGKPGPGEQPIPAGAWPMPQCPL